MTTREAATKLGVSISYVQRIIREGKLKATEEFDAHGQMYKSITRSALAAYVKTKKGPGNPNFQKKRKP